MAGKTDPLKVLEKELDSMKRGSPSNLEAYLKLIYDKEITDSKTKLFIKFVRLGPDKVPRTRDLCKWLVGAILDYTTPRDKIKDAKEADALEKVQDNISGLNIDARFIFSKSKTSGEFGEMLIYALLERFLQLPQLVAKMDLKTSFEQHFNGADGIHYDIKNNRPVIIISESKMKKDLGDGITECLKSLDSILSTKASIGQKLGNEIHVVRSHLNIDNEDLKKAMKIILDPSKSLYNSIDLMGAGLLCFDYDKYQNESNEASLEKIITDEVAKWEKSYLKRLKTHRKKDFEFIFFMIPFPSVEEVRKEFKEMLGI